MPLTNFLKFTFAVCLMLSLLTSCNKEVDPTTEEDNVAFTSVRSIMDNDSTSPNSEDSEFDEDENDLDCFTIVFPLDINFPNGTTLTITSEEELEEEVETYFEENPDTREDPRPVYPITVIIEGDQEQVIDNDEDLDALLERCHDFHDEDIIICFEIEYPITIIYPNGTSEDVHSDDELRNAIAAWESNATEEEEPTLNFPITIFLEDGTAVSINNDDELEAAFDSCYEDCEEDDRYDDHSHDDEFCFDITYPITLLFGDETQLVNNDDELQNTIDTWEMADPDSDQDITAEYPIEITYPDGTQQTLNSEEELESAVEGCDD